MAGLALQENKKFGSRYTEISVERTHSQIRNSSWASFPVSYKVFCTCIRTKNYNDNG